MRKLYNSRSESQTNTSEQLGESLNYAVKLPFPANRLGEEPKAHLIDMRESWYKDRSLNLWIHFKVMLKTQKHLIYDYFWFSSIQKVKDYFQPMYKKRLHRLGD